MSTDSSELTFVRCPSCRSLVPAASSRCKMCGASLDASAQPDQSEEERKKSSRVRQHTMTQASTELTGAAEQAREIEAAPEEIDEDPFDIFDMDDEDDMDIPESPKSRPSDEPAAGFDNPLSSFLPEDEEPQPAPAVIRKTAVPSNNPAPRVSASPAPSAPVQQSAAPKREERELMKPKVSIESGGRPQGKPSGLSFSNSKPKVEAAAEPQREKPVQERQSQAERQAQADRAEFSKEGPAKSVSEKNRLYGWLVSYDKSEGSAIELREGRFFISGTQLKPNDLVIPNRGLSTPHVLASINSSGGLKVQDLMSDGGLYVKKSNASAYTKEETSVQLQHGDWVKFGDVEFLVALISNGK